MKLNTNRYGYLIWLAALCLCASVAKAELTATVYPGYTLSANERPTTAILNLLARPTVTVSGTLGGTNVGLAANSVSGAMLMTSVVDDDTIEFFNNGGATAIRLKAYHTGTNAINSNIAGLGLGGGSGSPLSNKTDNVTITITNDTITLMTNLPIAHLNVASNSVVVGTTNSQALAMTPMQFWTNVSPFFTYTSTSVALSTVTAAGNYINEAHGLGRTPSFVQLVIVCTSSDLNYAVNDEVPNPSMLTSSWKPGGNVWCNSTNVGWGVADSAAQFRIFNKTTGAEGTITPSKWSVKIRARP